MPHIPILIAAFLAAMVPSAAAPQAPLQRAAALELLSASPRWAEVEGKMQADGTFLVKEVDIIAAEDTANMQEVEITGVIRDLDRRRSSLALLNYKVSWNEKTKISDQNKRQILSSKLEPDIGVRVRGQLQADGTFLARKIRLRDGTMKDGEMRYKEQLTGPVDVVDASAGALRILRTKIRLTPDCEFFALPVEVNQANP